MFKIYNKFEVPLISKKHIIKTKPIHNLIIYVFILFIIKNISFMSSRELIFDAFQRDAIIPKPHLVKKMNVHYFLINREKKCFSMFLA